MLLCRSIRCMSPKFDKALHDFIKAQPWQHSSFLSGTASRSQAQKHTVRVDEDDKLPHDEGDGGGAGVIPFAASPQDEAASDPPSDGERGDDDGHPHLLPPLLNRPRGE